MALRKNTGSDSMKSGYASGVLHASHVLQRWTSLLCPDRPHSVLRTPCGLECLARERDDAIGVISVGDVINRETAPALGAALLECLSRGRNVILSMSDVTGIDGAGVAVLVQAVAAARYRGLSLALVAVSQDVEAILELHRVKPLFPEYRHLADAERQVCAVSQSW